MKKELAVLYGRAGNFSTSFQTRELARHLEPWFSVRHLAPAGSGKLARVFHNFLLPLLRRTKTDYLLYGNDGFANLRQWRARSILYWYDTPADWSISPVTSVKDGLRKSNVRTADHVFAVSAAQVRVAKTLRPGREDSVHYLPVGVDCGFFDPAKADRAGARSRFGFAPKHTVIGYLGYLGRWQNRFAGEALLDVAAGVSFENVRFLVVGLGPALADWKARVAAIDLENRFTFAGFVPTPELPGAIAAMDICVDTLEPGFHSEARSETKLKQYMAMGRACVATDIGENRVDLDGGRAGILAEPNPRALAEAICRLIANPSEREAFGAAARERAISIYAWPVLAQKLVSALGLAEAGRR